MYRKLLEYHLEMDAISMSHFGKQSKLKCQIYSIFALWFLEIYILLPIPFWCLNLTLSSLQFISLHFWLAAFVNIFQGQRKKHVHLCRTYFGIFGHSKKYFRISGHPKKYFVILGHPIFLFFSFFFFWIFGTPLKLF